MEYEKPLYERKRSEILKYAKAEKTYYEYAIYLTMCWDVNLNQALKAIDNYLNDKEANEPLDSAIYEDARAELYISPLNNKKKNRLNYVYI